jgi:zinc protease
LRAYLGGVMTRLSRALRALAPFLLLAPLPLAAQQAAVAPATTAALPAPRYAQPNDPWIYRGTDIPIDREWLFGEMPNGVRYAVRQNSAPPGQVAIRVRIDAGSLHENDSELGFAHLLEHLTFRQSKYLGVAQAIPHFQRWGASLGHDTNAITSPTQTVYKLDLPNATPDKLDESIRLFSGMIREPVLNRTNLAAEVPIVLAERRERDGVERRAAEATREVFFAGQRLADHSPIGTVATLRGATPDAVEAFHRRWYRPENAVVVAVGDADPRQMAALIEKYFGDWRVPGVREPEPDFGDPQAPRGADPANPVGETRVIVEPGQARSLSYAVMRPWEQVTDNMEYNRGLMLGALAEAILNRRLEAGAREGGSYLFAAVESDKTSRSADATYVAITPLGDDWQAALKDVRAVIADAIATPPSQAEIDREVAEFDVVFANLVQQRRNLAGFQLADDVVNAVDIREAIAAPEVSLELLRGMRDRFAPAALHERTRALFEGVVVRALYMTPEADEADNAALRTALLAPVEGSLAARPSADPLAFADLPPIGTPAPPAVREPLGLFVNNDVEKVTFANGVRALLLPTTHEPGRVTVRVRFGGLQGFAPDEAVYAQLGEQALVASGLGELGLNELDRIATGRKFGFDFKIEEGTFVLEALTRSEDVADQLYLFAAKLAAPRWDAAPFERAKASALLAYDSYGSKPETVIQRDLEWLLHGRDPRFGTPDPAALRAATAEGFRAVWSRLLAQGPIEVLVFGDFDREGTVEALSRTFGALPQRSASPPPSFSAPPPFPAANDQPFVLTHRGQADQAAAAIAWPTGGGSLARPQGRKLELLAELFSNRLMDALRERAGASYSPYVRSTWPLDVSGGGNIMAMAQLPPAQVPDFFTAADQIAEDLATTGPTADELARVTEPMRQLLNRVSNSHLFWLNELEGAAFDRNRLAWTPTFMHDYTEVTPEEMKALAARYLGGHGGFRVAVLPDQLAARGGD